MEQTRIDKLKKELAKKDAEYKSSVSVIKKEIRTAGFLEFRDEVISEGTPVKLVDNNTKKEYNGFSHNGANYVVYWLDAKTGVYNGFKKAWASLVVKA